MILEILKQETISEPISWKRVDYTNRGSTMGVFYPDTSCKQDELHANTI